MKKFECSSSVTEKKRRYILTMLNKTIKINSVYKHGIREDQYFLKTNL